MCANGCFFPGAKEYGVFPIDPLFMSRVNIEQGHGPVSIDLHFNDINIYGLKKTKLIAPITYDSLKTNKENITKIMCFKSEN